MEPLEVACPACEAKPGENCTTSDFRAMRFAHAARIDVADGRRKDGAAEDAVRSQKTADAVEAVRAAQRAVEEALRLTYGDPNDFAMTHVYRDASDRMAEWLANIHASVTADRVGGGRR